MSVVFWGAWRVDSGLVAFLLFGEANLTRLFQSVLVVGNDGALPSGCLVMVWTAFLWPWLDLHNGLRCMSEVSCVFEDRAELGEGVFWSEREQRVFWIDIVGQRVCRFDPVTGLNESVSVGQEVGTVVEAKSGGLLAALKDGVYALGFESGELRKCCDPMEGNADNRLNDGKAGPDGRFYVGGLGDEGKQHLYRIDRNTTDFARIEDGISISNGLAWSSDDRTFYYIDTPQDVVWAYDFDGETGSISNRRVAVDVKGVSGAPDGMTIDAEGMLWVAFWDGWCVRRYDPNSGELLREIRLPAARVTCCGFGGKDLDTLYITTARGWLEDAELEKQPLAGSLFAVKPGVKGVPSFLFGE
ncbi:SMP-30/gluconolactonase/LRE family protein [Pelagicoccus mobilis]|uniref:SMP-30/gluconolactonase/LRE family protein n=1 Tax=Pelagicoccus mobilis TaxID=415221 RepID=A0A934RYX5_9BACT|nr:SMP-30/gluconolactonase/LRE family protein [Pelagicoccus mobilis]MBK1878893.1 SMP-30/gluconolactonase/LRE family protein [Pelagicoccus mobilis]